MMFSSGKHANLTTDPKPWKVWLETPYAMHGHREWRGSATGWDDALERAEVAYPKFTSVSAVLMGRPEFDRPLANPANPILAAFRSTEGRLTGNAVAADYWMSALDSYDTFGGYVTWEHSGFRSIIDARNHERDHARRVLSRLAGLT